MALLFVAGTALHRGDITRQLHIGMGRLALACAFVRAGLPPLGLTLVEHANTLELASAGDCAAAIERALGVAPPEPLSGAAHQVLAIVAYEQLVTRADIERIRGVDSGGVIESLLARGLVVEERRRFGVRGGPVPLMTTAAFLRYLGLTSPADLAQLAPVGTSSDAAVGVGFCEHRRRVPVCSASCGVCGGGWHRNHRCDRRRHRGQSVPRVLKRSSPIMDSRHISAWRGAAVDGAMLMQCIICVRPRAVCPTTGYSRGSAPAGEPCARCLDAWDRVQALPAEQRPSLSEPGPLHHPALESLRQNAGRYARRARAGLAAA